jgi:hypothetical protein
MSKRRAAASAPDGDDGDELPLGSEPPEPAGRPPKRARQASNGLETDDDDATVDDVEVSAAIAEAEREHVALAKKIDAAGGKVVSWRAVIAALSTRERGAAHGLASSRPFVNRARPHNPRSRRRPGPLCASR